MLSTIGRLIPRSQVKALGKKLSTAGIVADEEEIAGAIVLLPVFVFIAAAAAILYSEIELIVWPATAILGGVFASVIVIGIFYEILELRGDERRKEVENILPDFLQLAAANIRAGMHLDKAIWYAARPEYGVFSKEVELAAKRIFSGESIDSSLDALSARFTSRYLDRTIALIKEGVVSGGEMATILEKTAYDLRNVQLMQKEISANMIMYSIFIAFSAIIGAPFLYSVSYKLVALFEKLAAQTPATAAAGISPVQPAVPSITSAEFALFSAILVLITSIFACAMVAAIQTGQKRNAIKYLLPFLAVTFGVFWGARALLDRLFG